MSKPFLGVGVLALGVVLAGGQSHAAVPAGQVVVAQLRSSGAYLLCKQCAIYRTPKPGDTVTLNPQPLPPGSAGHAWMPRR
jgi:hypothetical protein